MPQRPQNQTRRQAKGSGGSFNIFSDDASASESETQQQKSAGKQQKHKTLGLARVNSLLLPGKQRPRRALRREVEGYDKENDVPEHATDGHRTPDVTPTRPNASQAPSRSRRENVSARQPEIDPYQEYEEQPELSCEEEDSSDSLDGFIVSDNDEPSSYETSDAEATDQEDEPSPPPSPVRSPRKRLMRGRKPNSETRPEPINTSKEEPSIEAKQLPQKLDQYVEREKAISREGDDCTPHLYQTSSIDKIDEADAFKTQLDSTSPIHPSLYNSNDLIRHLEDLELDSDNDSSPQPQTGRTR